MPGKAKAKFRFKRKNGRLCKSSPTLTRKRILNDYRTSNMKWVKFGGMASVLILVTILIFTHYKGYTTDVKKDVQSIIPKRGSPEKDERRPVEYMSSYFQFNDDRFQEKVNGVGAVIYKNKQGTGTIVTMY